MAQADASSENPSFDLFCDDREWQFLLLPHLLPLNQMIRESGYPMEDFFEPVPTLPGVSTWNMASFPHAGRCGRLRRHCCRIQVFPRRRRWWRRDFLPRLALLNATSSFSPSGRRYSYVCSDFWMPDRHSTVRPTNGRGRSVTTLQHGLIEGSDTDVKPSIGDRALIEPFEASTDVLCRARRVTAPPCGKSLPGLTPAT